MIFTPALAAMAGIAIGDEVTEFLFGSSINYSGNVDWDSARMVLEAEIAELDRARRAESADSSGAVIAVSSWAEVRQQVSELRNRLKKNVYSFDVFEVDSFNFGLKVTHRQTWVPGPYQAGELVASLPLAPGERREITSRQVVKQTAAERNSYKTNFRQSTERTTTTRAEEKIFQKATTNSSFDATVSGEFSIVEVVDVTASTKIGTSAATETSRTQSSFREAVLKAASEYSRERVVEVSTTTEVTRERSQTGVISNPNNEITVTYLFYELQRQYRISERLRSVIPYVFVARHIPAPHEVDVDFLISHAWILKKALLEPGLGEVLEYLEEDYAGEVVALDYLRDRWQVHRDLVRRLSFQVEALRKAQEQVTEQVSTTITAKGEKEGLFENVGEFLFGGTDDETSRAAAQEAAERSMEYVSSDLQDLTARLVAATDAFSNATAELASGAAEHANWKIRIDQARIHVKENILWYMHAIWDHEVPDQRFFEFYNKMILVPEPPETEITVGLAGSGLVAKSTASLSKFQSPNSSAALLEKAGSSRVDFELKLDKPLVDFSEPDNMNWKQLVDIADLNDPIYVGNMIGFPLKEHNYLTMWMASEYVDDELGVSDPDPYRELDLEQAIENINCGSLSREDKAELIEILVDKLHDPSNDSDTIVIPTGELFVEALPGSHPVLEHFKLEHRKIDLERAAYAAAGEEMETIRRASRVLEGNLEDPDVDRLIHFEGAPAPTPTVDVEGADPPLDDSL